MDENLLNEKELQEAIRYEIISPSFAERVRELIKAHEQQAAQQSVQATPPLALVCECGSLYGVHEEFCPKYKSAGGR